MSKHQKSLDLYEIIDELDSEMVKIDESYMSFIPKRLDKLEASAINIEKIAVKLQEQIKAMRRK